MSLRRRNLIAILAVSVLVAAATSRLAEAGDLPGLGPLPEPVAALIEDRIAALGATHRARTKHLLPDGRPRYTNRLILESSPYLLQHANNPVNWYPWGEEALAAARDQDKPILLSIGYSTCHWCHVMEDESFDNLKIAAYLNQNYIAIKVDREERPDIDSIYMSALQSMKGAGGWPMTLWLTPVGEPFFGDTYIPPFDGDRGVRQGFLTLLETLYSAYRENSQQIGRITDNLMAAVAARVLPEAGTALPADDVFDRAFSDILRNYDSEAGGLATDNKFPSHLPVRFLLRYSARGGDPSALSMVQQTLTAMKDGGIYDQVGGGFHRYSTDRLWQVPHFEKMLYDNAQLVLTYLEAFQATGDPEFSRIVQEVLAYIARDLRGAAGGFRSATDADSPDDEGVMREGWYYTWPESELRRLLDAEALAAFHGAYAMTPHNGRNVLRASRLRGEIETATAATVDTLRATLLAARSKRSAPFTDTKIVTSLNAMTVSAFARASLVLDDPGYLEIAQATGEFLARHMLGDNRLYRVYREGGASGMAFADDYAFLSQAFLDLYEAGGQLEWFRLARTLDRQMQQLLEDPDEGGFFFAPESATGLPSREKPGFDSSTPSANAIAIMNLLRLGELTTDDSYRQRADRALKYFSRLVGDTPAAAPTLLQAFDFYDRGAMEIVIVTPGDRNEARPFLQKLYADFQPNHVLAVVRDGDDAEEQAAEIPLITGKRALRNVTTAYVCERGICDLPTSDPEVFAEQLRSRL